jgi:Zn-dependent protease with chaperone function
LSLPFPFLLGLFVVVAHRELVEPLPGQGRLDDLVWTASLLTAPWLLAAMARAAALGALVTGRRPWVPPRALLRLSMFAGPLALHALFTFGCYGEWVDRWAPESASLRVALLLLPLYLTELPRLVTATMVEEIVESGSEGGAASPIATVYLPRWREVWPTVRLRLGWPLLALMPAAVYGVGVDLLQLWRPAYVFALATAAGMSLAAMCYLVVASALLPFWFRVAFGVLADVPEPHGATLRETARQLAFSPRRLFVLPTGMRAVNAMMVGPLPFGRLLCFTDGLIQTLDPRSLAGVLAHEVGHARMGHPGLLALLGFVVPVMLLSPLRLLEADGGDVVLLSTIMVGGVLVVWLGLRTLARRFEHEADIASVQVLGAEPCSRALWTVSRATLPAAASVRSRLTSLHPDEGARLQTMQRYEADPGFRREFDRRTVALRRGLLAIVLGAVAVGAWFWALDWPYERVVVRFHTGDMVGARSALDELDEVPARWREAMSRIEAQLEAAEALAPDVRDWEGATRALVPAAWERGEQVLLREGPAAAYRWLALAVAVTPSPTTTELAIYRFCKAAADRDPDATIELGRIVLRRGPPASLEPVFRDYQ